MILYFSGTGNSAYAAKVIAEIVEDTRISISDRLKARNWETVVTEKPLVFVVPTYAWRIPRLVEQWIEKMTFSGNQKAYFVMTCGGGTGNAGKYLRKLCRKKGFEYMGYKEIVMPENYVAMFPVPKEEEAVSIIQKAEPYIRSAAECVKNNKPLQEEKITVLDKLSSGIVNDLFYGLFVKDRKFYTTDACISCGKCVKACPLHNIKLTDGKPQWNKNCTHCMACITGCPTEAIEYGKASIGKARYRCPLD